MAAVPAIRSRSFELVAAVPTPSSFAERLSAAGASPRDLNLFDDQGSRLSQVDIINQLRRIVIEQSPDLIFANSLSSSRWVGPVADALRLPSVGYLRDIIGISKKAVADINLNSCIVAVSEATKTWHVNHGMDESRIITIHNGVNLKTFYPRVNNDERSVGIRDELDIGDEAKLILFVGQIGIRKGVDLLLDVAGLLCQRHDDLHVLIVGERHSRKEESVKYEKNLHLVAGHSFPHGRVHFLGRRDDVSELMRHSDVLVHPARQEPLGRVLLEAAASGLPIVTTDVGGSREILADHPSLLFDANCFDDCVPRLEQLLSDDGEASEISRSLRAMAERRFDAVDAGDRLADTIEATIQKHQRNIAGE